MTTASQDSAPWSYVLDQALRILVADDDPLLREFASVYLSTPTATIDTACDGAAAWDRLGQDRYDALLLDIEMPGLDGYSLLQKIRTDDRLRHLPVIMLTGREDIASIDRAYRLGASSFTTKPVNWRQLSYHIRYVVRTSRAMADLPRVPDATSGYGAVAAESEARALLQLIAERSSALEPRLVGNGHCLQPVRNIGAAARLALIECSERASSSSHTGTGGPTSTPVYAGSHEPPMDRKSADATALQT